MWICFFFFFEKETNDVILYFKESYEDYDGCIFIYTIAFFPSWMLKVLYTVLFVINTSQIEQVHVSLLEFLEGQNLMILWTLQ